MPNLLTEFFDSPTSPLLTVRCKPWTFRDKCVIMGDAAHAVVPFYGQGMNSGFEDALLFDELWTQHSGDAAKVIAAFGALRQPQTDALADLSIDNFNEMASKTASAAFLAKKQFESVLYRISPSLWTPLYTMVSYTRIPFDEAKRRADQQDKSVALHSTPFQCICLRTNLVLRRICVCVRVRVCVCAEL
jgi:kynurenine 3-monooxygenase